MYVIPGLDNNIDKDDLIDVLEAVLPIKSVYFALGRSLRLETADLKSIREAYPGESDAELALSDTLELWLQQKYNSKRFGPPTWRMLVEAVDRKGGGNNRELAKEIASNHPVTGSYSMANGQLTRLSASLISTWRELRAVDHVLCSFAPKLKGHTVRWSSDNQNVIPRSDNDLADYISKHRDFDDWKVNPVIFQNVDEAWGPFTVLLQTITANLNVFTANFAFLTPKTILSLTRYPIILIEE